MFSGKWGKKLSGERSKKIRKSQIKISRTEDFGLDQQGQSSAQRENEFMREAEEPGRPHEPCPEQDRGVFPVLDPNAFHSGSSVGLSPVESKDSVADGKRAESANSTPEDRARLSQYRPSLKRQSGGDTTRYGSLGGREDSVFVASTFYANLCEYYYKDISQKIPPDITGAEMLAHLDVLHESSGARFTDDPATAGGYRACKRALERWIADDKVGTMRHLLDLLQVYETIKKILQDCEGDTQNQARYREVLQVLGELRDQWAGDDSMAVNE